MEGAYSDLKPQVKAARRVLSPSTQTCSHSAKRKQVVLRSALRKGTRLVAFRGGRVQNEPARRHPDVKDCVSSTGRAWHRGVCGASAKSLGASRRRPSGKAESGRPEKYPRVWRIAPGGQGRLRWQCLRS